MQDKKELFDPRPVVDSFLDLFIPDLNQKKIPPDVIEFMTNDESKLAGVTCFLVGFTNFDLLPVELSVNWLHSSPITAGATAIKYLYCILEERAPMDVKNSFLIGDPYYESVCFYLGVEYGRDYNNRE